MKPLSRLVLSSCLGAAVAVAASSTQAAPAQGTRELRFRQQLLGDTAGPFGFTSIHPENGESQSLASMAAGLGYFVSDHVALGATVGYVSLERGSSSVSGPMIEPFLRVYTMLTPRIGAFADAVFGYQHLSGDGDASVAMQSFGADAGLEFFVTDSWGIRVAPTYRRLHRSSESDFTDSSIDANMFGVQYGIAAYY